MPQIRFKIVISKYYLKLLSITQKMQIKTKVIPGFTKKYFCPSAGESHSFGTVDHLEDIFVHRLTH